MLQSSRPEPTFPSAKVPWENWISHQSDFRSCRQVPSGTVLSLRSTCQPDYILPPCPVQFGAREMGSCTTAHDQTGLENGTSAG